MREFADQLAFWMCWLTSIEYVAIAVAYLVTGRRGLAIAFIAYAVAQIGISFTGRS